MAMTERGRIAAGAVSLLVVGAVVAGLLVFGGHDGGAATHGAATGGNDAQHGGDAVPALCPLTGSKPPSGTVPNRPALAVKVENLPEARPQIGLSYADLVYEEPVEAFITRFIVVYQCQDAQRIEPVRSARLTDPDVLVQFGRPVFGYAGGVPQVTNKVRAAGLIDVNYLKAAGAYHRDPGRPIPHNLYTSTKELYAAAGVTGGVPSSVFTYSTDAPSGGKAIANVHLPFSNLADVNWTWSASKGRWLRSYGTVPATYSDGTQIDAENVVIQMVKVITTSIVDANGVHSPEVVATGKGVCYVLRDGKMVKGTWSRPTLKDITMFKDPSGQVIALSPGTTWVELMPNTLPVTSS